MIIKPGHSKGCQMHGSWGAIKQPQGLKFKHPSEAAGNHIITMDNDVYFLR